MLSLETKNTSSGSFKTKVTSAVAATAAIGVIAAVTLSSTSSVQRQKTGLFNIPEDVKGHFSGGQTGGQWTVQGKFHKFEKANGDWQIDSKLTVEGPAMGGSETYTLKDDVLVMAPNYDEHEDNELECGDRENVGAYRKWAEVLANGSAIVKSDMTGGLKTDVEANCPAGATAVVVKVDSRTYVICADSTASSRSMYAFNSDFSFSAVSREGMTVDIEHPSGWEKLNCTTFDTSKTALEASNLLGLDDIDRELQGDGNFAGPGGMGAVGPDPEVDPRTIHFIAGLSSSNGEEIERALGYFGYDPHEEETSTIGGGEGGLAGKPPPPGKGPYMSCAFYHGVGINGKDVGLRPDTGRIKSGKMKYWGTPYVDQACSNTNKIMFTDSRNRGFDNHQYQQEVCASLSPLSAQSRGTYPYYSGAGNRDPNYYDTDNDFYYQSRSVIFTHSMGGMVTRAAFANNVCSWSGKYYQTQPPMSGSKSSNFGEQLCMAIGGGFPLTPHWQKLFGLFKDNCEYKRGTGLAWLFKYGRMYKGYLSVKKDYPKYANAGKRADERLCGNSPKGLGGKGGRTLKKMQFVVGLQRRRSGCRLYNWACAWRGCYRTNCLIVKREPHNDGVVPWDSCGFQHNAHGAHITAMPLNHFDAPGRFGGRSQGQVDTLAWFQERSFTSYVVKAPGCTNCKSRAN